MVAWRAFVSNALLLYARPRHPSHQFCAVIFGRTTSLGGIRYANDFAILFVEMVILLTGSNGAYPRVIVTRAFRSMVGFVAIDTFTATMIVSIKAGTALVIAFR